MTCMSIDIILRSCTVTNFNGTKMIDCIKSKLIIYKKKVN